jgi:alpha-1,2-mannosyltransferase
LSTASRLEPLRRAYGVRLFFDPGVQRTALFLLLGIVLVFRFGQFVVFSSQIQWGYDFSAYWQAGRNVLDGQPIYSAAQLAGPYAPQQQFLYLYPPFLAVVVAPLAALFADYRLAAWAWTGLGFALAIASVVAVGRREGLISDRGRLVLLVGGAFTIPAVIAELVMGNVHLVLLGLFAAAWLGIRRGDRAGDVVAGVAIGAATLIKVFPALLIVWLVLAGRWRAAAVSVATIGLLTLAVLPATGIEPWLQYPQVLANLSEPSSTSDALAPTTWLTPVLGFTVARVLVTVVALAMLAWSVRRQAEGASFAVAVMASVLIAPALYHHYLAIAVLPFLLALAHARLRWWLAIAYGGLLGGKQPELGELMWVVNRGLPTIGALTLLVGLLLTGRRRDLSQPDRGNDLR